MQIPLKWIKADLLLSWTIGKVSSNSKLGHCWRNSLRAGYRKLFAPLHNQWIMARSQSQYSVLHRN